jgi:hypothetical protein
VELVSNPGFESGLGGWTASSGTTLVRTCSTRHGGSCSAALGRTTSGNALLDDSPNSVSSTPAGAVYSGSAWVRAPSGRTVTLRVRELRGTATVRSTVLETRGTGGWALLAVKTKAASGGTSLGVEVVVSLVKGTKAYVDDVSLKRSS